VANFFYDGILRPVSRWKDIIKMKLNETWFVGYGAGSTGAA
jgi:hypothetical protein